MSVGGIVVEVGEGCHMMPVTCLPPPAPQPTVTFLFQPPVPPPASFWTTTTTSPSFTTGPTGVSVSGGPAPPALLQKKLVRAEGHPNPQCPSVPLPQLPRTSFHVGYFVPPSVEPGDRFGGLESVWHQQFEMLFQNLPNRWSFSPTETIPSGWNVFRDKAKVRFSCQQCCHAWTSMNGLVVFCYRWDATMNLGSVLFLLTGQMCNRCDHHGFETPMWYPEEVQKVTTNLYHDVASRVYQMQTPPLIRDRRFGRPQHHHNNHKCQGCFLGQCYL